MATQQKQDDTQTTQPTASFGELLADRYHKIKENAETYLYVWASYIIIYGGFALWTTYRWRKLRKTEDRVRALQETLNSLRMKSMLAPPSQLKSFHYLMRKLLRRNLVVLSSLPLIDSDLSL